MGAIQDLLTDINNYPDGNVEITITLLPVATRPGEEPDTVINVGETRLFNVKVENNGNLNMKNLKLFIEGSNWADVGTNEDGPFESDFISTGQDVDARSSAIFGQFALKATQNTNNGEKKIVRCHIQTYDADFEYILSGLKHGAEVPEATLDREVFPA